MVSISGSNLTEVPKASKKIKDSFENGLVSEKIKTNQVVELEEKEQIEIKAGDILGKLGLFSYDWIEEPVIHLEVFTFDDVKVFQEKATEAYEKEDEKKEKKYVVGGLINYTFLSNSLESIKVHNGDKLKITDETVGNQQVVTALNGKTLSTERPWKISSKFVKEDKSVEDKKAERPKPNILYVPKKTTELFEKGYDDTIYAKVKKGGTNIRKGTTNEGKKYGGGITLENTELVLGTTTTETKVAKSKDKEAYSYYRQSVLEIAGKKVDGYTIHTDYFEIIQKDLFVPKKTQQKLKTSIVKPKKNLKIEKDKEGIEYIEVAKFPSLYVKKYKNEEQTKSWFTHGVTLKMFDVMKETGNDGIGIFDDTIAYLDERNDKTQKDKEKLNPLFKEILLHLKLGEDTDKSGTLEAGELAGLSLSQEKRKELSYIVAKHESEWEDATRYEPLIKYLNEIKNKDRAKMIENRIKKLSFFDDVMALDFSPTFFHPVALVGVMVRSCSINIKLARVKAFLQMLRHGEGTVGDKGYETLHFRQIIQSFHTFHLI